jgi:UDPglucose 6-dehydrogenase
VSKKSAGWERKMNLVVIGTGYVGLVAGSCLVDFGHYVTCVDKDVHRIGTLLSGQTPFFEPGLEEVIQTNVAKGRLRFSNDLSEPVQKAAAVVIAVGTPARNGDGQSEARTQDACRRSHSGRGGLSRASLQSRPAKLLVSGHGICLCL